MIDPRQSSAGGARTGWTGQHPLLALLVRRISLGLVTLSLVSVVVFAATQLLPGDAARAVLGRTATPERLAALREQLHLERPAVVQYWLWLSGILSGSSGTSLVHAQSVSALVLPRVHNSLVLLVLTGMVSVPLSMAIGIAAALQRNRALDAALSIAALAIAALPEFVVSIGVIIVFATVVFHWFPPVSLVPPGASVLASPSILALPVLTLTIVVFPYIFRMMRSSMIDVLESEYMEMARLKGIGNLRLLLLHAFPNAIAPTAQVIALTFAYLAGGIVVVEYVFGFPGIGQGLVDAVTSRDIPVLQFIVVLLASIYILLNLLADFAVVLVTPRLRTGAEHRL